MRIVFSGLEKPIDVKAGDATVLQVLSPHLFARIALSLQSGAGVEACEAYTIWEGESEVRPKDALFFVPDALNLPWTDRRLINEVVKRMEREFLADEDLRKQVEKAEQMLSSSMFGLTLGLDSSYSFNAEWDFKKFLSSHGFAAAVQPGASYLDNLTNFLSLIVDSGCSQTVVFVNLKTFLSKNDLVKFYEHVFYTKLHVLLLENKVDVNQYEHEIKRIVDQDFLEY